jgi:hypothetical protein
VPFGKHRQLRVLGGAWCEVLLRPFPPDHNASPQPDAVLKRPVTREEAVKAHGCRAYAVGVRRLGREELKSLPIPVDLLRRPCQAPAVVR